MIHMAKSANRERQGRIRTLHRTWSRQLRAPRPVNIALVRSDALETTEMCWTRAVRTFTVLASVIGLGETMT